MCRRCADGQSSAFDRNHRRPGIVEYSKRLTNEQSALVQRFNISVRSSEEFRNADATGKLPPNNSAVKRAEYHLPVQANHPALRLRRSLPAHPRDSNESRGELDDSLEAEVF